MIDFTRYKDGLLINGGFVPHHEVLESSVEAGRYEEINSWGSPYPVGYLRPGPMILILKFHIDLYNMIDKNYPGSQDVVRW